LFEASPDLDKDGVVRWRCVDLKRVVSERFGVDLSEVSLGRILKQLNFSRISARPRHPAQDDQAIPTFKKRARIGRPPVAVETDCAIVDQRGAAEKFLVDLTPQKNVVHGLLRTCEW
jgi:hypothetical protein